MNRIIKQKVIGYRHDTFGQINSVIKNVWSNGTVNFQIYYQNRRIGDPTNDMPDIDIPIQHVIDNLKETEL